MNVRTTLNIDDDLYRQVKATAALRGLTVTSVIEEALRQALLVRSAAVDVSAPPVLPQGGGTRPGVDLTDNRLLYSLMYDEDDLRLYGPGGPDGPR